MARFLGYLAGLFMCFDGLLGILGPARSRQLWRDVGGLLPEPMDQYFEEVVQTTEKYQSQAPAAFRAMYGLEVVVGLVVLRLASRGR